MIPFIPSGEIMFFLFKLSKNRPFLRIGRIFMLSLVALTAVGYAGAWIKGFEPGTPACTDPRWGCYSGGPLTMLEFVAQLGGPRILLVLPVAELGVALLFLFNHRRMYLWGMVNGMLSVLLQLYGSNPMPYIHVLTGSGYWMAQMSSLFLGLLCFPLAIIEQTRLHPEKYGAFRGLPSI